MKKSIISLFVLLSVFFAYSIVAHAERPGVMTISWEYPNPDADVAGFRVYDSAGALVADITDPNARDYTGPVTISTGRDEEYTMTAYDSDGNESDHTDPFLAKTYPAAPGNAAGHCK